MSDQDEIRPPEALPKDTRSDLHRRQRRRVIVDEVRVSSSSCTEKTRDDLTDAVRERGECNWTRRASMVTVRSWMKNRRQGSDPQCLSPEKGHGLRRGKSLRQSLRLPRH